MANFKSLFFHNFLNFYGAELVITKNWKKYPKTQPLLNSHATFHYFSDTETKDTKETIEPVEIIKSEVKSEPPEQPPIIPAEPVVFAPETKPIGNYSNLEISH